VRGKEKDWTRTRCSKHQNVIFGPPTIFLKAGLECAVRKIHLNLILTGLYCLIVDQEKYDFCLKKTMRYRNVKEFKTIRYLDA
jgi:hypothetical protein